MKAEFNLEHQYQLYLEKVNLKESEMHYAQRIETRRAFMGACGQIIVLLRDDLTKLDEREALATLQNMTNQVGDFFVREYSKRS